jgi:hypothetical protein
LSLGKRKSGPTQATPAAVKRELEKLAYLPRLDAHTLDLSVLPAERRRFLAGWVPGRRRRRCSAAILKAATTFVGELDLCNG